MKKQSRFLLLCAIALYSWQCQSSAPEIRPSDGAMLISRTEVHYPWNSCGLDHTDEAWLVKDNAFPGKAYIEQNSETGIYLATLYDMVLANDIGMVKLLLENGARDICLNVDFLTLNATCDNAYALALKLGYTEIAELIKELEMGYALVKLHEVIKIEDSGIAEKILSIATKSLGLSKEILGQLAAYACEQGRPDVGLFINSELLGKSDEINKIIRAMMGEGEKWTDIKKKLCEQSRT